MENIKTSITTGFLAWVLEWKDINNPNLQLKPGTELSQHTEPTHEEDVCLCCAATVLDLFVMQHHHSKAD